MSRCPGTPAPGERVTCCSSRTRRFANPSGPLIGIRKQPVLTVSDGNGFAAAGGIIELYVDKGRMRFAINLDAVEQSGLNLSSRLLGLARIVRGVPARSGAESPVLPRELSRSVRDPPPAGRTRVIRVIRVDPWRYPWRQAGSPLTAASIAVRSTGLTRWWANPASRVPAIRLLTVARHGDEPDAVEAGDLAQARGQLVAVHHRQPDVEEARPRGAKSGAIAAPPARRGRRA